MILDTYVSLPWQKKMACSTDDQVDHAGRATGQAGLQCRQHAQPWPAVGVGLDGQEQLEQVGQVVGSLAHGTV